MGVYSMKATFEEWEAVSLGKIKTIVLFKGFYCIYRKGDNAQYTTMFRCANSVFIFVLWDHY